jgi:hypothetical protein
MPGEASMPTERAEPILPSRDLRETRTFYGRLGFAPWWSEDRPWDYDIFSRLPRPAFLRRA